MESDFHKLPIDVQEQIVIAQNMLNGFVHDESPEKDTIDFEASNGHNKAVFKLVRKNDSAYYEFDYALLNI